MSHDIFLNIDTIVLRGLAHVDRHILAEALQQALVEQLSSNPTLTTADLSRVQTNITLPGHVSETQLGQALAQSLSGIITNSNSISSPTQKQTSGGKRHG